MIFPFTTLLVPLVKDPTLEEQISPPSPPPPTTTTTTTSPSSTAKNSNGRKNSGSGRKLIIVGVVVGVLVAFGFCAAGVFLFRRFRSGKDEENPTLGETTLTEKIRRVMNGSLTAYKVEDLNKATNYFSQENRINCS